MKEFSTIDKEKIEEMFWGVGTNSFNRMETFFKYKRDLSPLERYYGFRVAYDSSDNLYANRNKIKKFLSDIKLNDEVTTFKNIAMEDSELQYYKSLPNKLTVYRGMTEKELISQRFGVSWTLKKEVAEFFAFKYWRNMSTAKLPKTVHSLEIAKEDVLAFLNDRNEFEVLILL